MCVFLYNFDPGGLVCNITFISFGRHSICIHALTFAKSTNDALFFISRSGILVALGFIEFICSLFCCTIAAVSSDLFVFDVG